MSGASVPRRELALDDHLGRDARVIRAGLPERLPTVHARETDQRVHQGVLERVTHVQRAGHVRRRDHDAIRLAIARRRKPARRLPAVVDAGLDVAGE
jgi:hypothetical protein